MPSRRQAIAILGLAAMMPQQVLASSVDFLQHQRALIRNDPNEFIAALEAIKERGKPDMAAGLIQAMRFSKGPDKAISDVIAAITGHAGPQTWFEWMLWQERTPKVVPHPTFYDFKREIFLGIDPNFKVFLRPEHLLRQNMRIRFEEITWGGVRKDGIPALDNPDLIPASEAEYMRDEDLVFGVSINGDTRAYPLRIMGWHEMFNDVVGGVPVALAYCTLCGSGILFETKVPTLAEPLVFGSSGFLYRSNKLMFDRATHSLWNQFTGKPISGELVSSGIKLTRRAVVIDTWKNWRKANPKTRILALDTGYSRDYGSGVVYQNYFASKDLMFPTNVDQSKNQQKDFVFGVQLFGGAKAWPISAFANKPIINDEMQNRPLVLIGNTQTRTVRAYERGKMRFSGGATNITSQDGTRWRMTEDALVASDGRSLARVPGHISYWFAWNGYLGAKSELYDG